MALWKQCASVTCRVFWTMYWTSHYISPYSELTFWRCLYYISCSHSLRCRQPTRWLRTTTTRVWHGRRACRRRHQSLQWPVERRRRGSASLDTRRSPATRLPRRDLLPTCRTPAWPWRLLTSCISRCATKVTRLRWFPSSSSASSSSLLVYCSTQKHRINYTYSLIGTTQSNSN